MAIELQSMLVGGCGLALAEEGGCWRKMEVEVEGRRGEGRKKWYE